MHLLERYALACGVKIDKPFIYEKYFPLLVDKYITIHTTSKDSKTYSYWQEVVDILIPILSKHQISIVQVGGKSDRPLNFVYTTLGQTNINQVAYIVNNGILHLGIDSFPAHLAGYYDKPIVALYSNNFVECVKPYWGNPEKQILMEPEHGDLKPSFSYNENPKTINRIKPESIACSVCKLLDIPFTYEYETVYIGPLFENRILETLPNQVVNPAQFNAQNMVVRMDMEFNEQNLANQIAVSKCIIITNKPIHPELLSKFKQKIQEIHYELTPEHNIKFVEYARNLGIKVDLFTYFSNEKLEALKMDYFDFGMIHPQNKDVPEEITKLGDIPLFYKSSKFTLSSGKIFVSHAGMRNGQLVNNLSDHLLPVVNTEEFWKEKHHFRIVKYK
jgi:hypothetical protein